MSTFASQRAIRLGLLLLTSASLALAAEPETRTSGSSKPPAATGTTSTTTSTHGNTGSATNTATKTTSITPAPTPDPLQISAARFLEQASFGPTPAELTLVKQIGPAAWITQQMALPASAWPAKSDGSNAAMTNLRNTWYKNMANGPDQLRQRSIFALSQIFVVSANKNPYANELAPWLQTLSTHAFGNFNNLLREMTLNPAMGKYLDLGNSVTPAPNENYAREVMQLFTIGPVMLNMDGSVQRDSTGIPVPSYNQGHISAMARALSGWTYPGPAGRLNFESFTGPLQARDAWHDKKAKTLVGDITLPAGRTTLQDYDAAMQTLFQHPNLPPFIATRLIRNLTSSNPSPAYIERVATVFANGAPDGSGTGRGDLAATIKAILLDPEARQDQAASNQGHLKDPMLHSLGLVRALGAKVVDPTNIFYDYFLLGERILEAPSVFNFYSPQTRLPGAPQYYGPEFQLYSPSQAVARANFIYNLINGNYKTMIKFDLTPYLAVASDPNALLNLVDANLLQGRMSANARQAIGSALLASSSDKTQRVLTTLYLSAISAEFAVHQ